jgi:hypothetical protein
MRARSSVVIAPSVTNCASASFTAQDFRQVLDALSWHLEKKLLAGINGNPGRRE